MSTDDPQQQPFLFGAPETEAPEPTPAPPGEELSSNLQPDREEPEEPDQTPEETGEKDSAHADELQRDDALDDWKDALRRDFESWLESLDEIPELNDEDVLDDAPDLYSFYEQLAAGTSESRKTNRRTAEAISQWGDTLARFADSLAPLQETTAKLAAAQPKDDRMSRAHCLVLVELLDRLHRLGRAFQTPPVTKPSWWGSHDRAWRATWETQHQAFDILVGHLEALLKKEGVTRIETLDRPFDPALMTAVAAEADSSRPPQTVIEETAPGYLRDGEPLRAAQVKVSRAP